MVILIGKVVIFVDSYGDLMNFNAFVSWFNGDVWMDFNFNGDLMDFNDFQWLSMVILPHTIRIEQWTSRNIEYSYEEITNGSLKGGSTLYTWWLNGDQQRKTSSLSG